MPDVLRHIPVCRTVWWKGVRSGRYPKGHKIAPNVTAWAAEDIHALIADLKAKPTVGMAVGNESEYTSETAENL